MDYKEIGDTLKGGCERANVCGRFWFSEIRRGLYLALDRVGLIRGIYSRRLQLTWVQRQCTHPPRASIQTQLDSWVVLPFVVRPNHVVVVALRNAVSDKGKTRASA